MRKQLLSQLKNLRAELATERKQESGKLLLANVRMRVAERKELHAMRKLAA